VALFKYAMQMAGLLSLVRSYKMEIQSVQYHKSPTLQEITSIKVTKTDGTVSYVPTSIGNADYDEIMRQVAAGTLTIADAD
jgi:hypothetical protein